MRNAGKLLFTLCLFVIGGATVANAQVDAGPQIDVNVPFGFTVDNTRLPAGKYEIRILDENSPNVLEIRSLDKRTSVVFDTSDAQLRDGKTANKSELIFTKLGDQYFLSQIWISGSGSGSELPQSRLEKRLARGGSQPEKQSVVASVRKP